MGYWTGQDCELDEEECSKDSCHNNGTCIEAVGGTPTCICEPGKLSMYQGHISVYVWDTGRGRTVN